MKNETEFNERVEQEAFEMSQKTYFPEDSAEKKMDNRKQQLQKELLEIEIEEHKGDKLIEAQKMARLRKEVEAHQREQVKINQAVNNQFSQMTHTNKDGRIIYGS